MRLLLEELRRGKCLGKGLEVGKSAPPTVCSSPATTAFTATPASTSDCTSLHGGGDVGGGHIYDIGWHTAPQANESAQHDEGAKGARRHGKGDGRQRDKGAFGRAKVNPRSSLL